MTYSDPPFQGRTLKGIIIGILAVIGLFLCAHPVFAYDLTITCGASSCVKDTNSPLFPSTILWYPGQTTQKIIHFVNTTSDTRTLSTEAVNSSQTGNIDTVMQFLMQQSGSSSSLWDNTLRTLYGASIIALPNISPNNTFDLSITITMHDSAGNEFQNKKTTFDLSFAISGVDQSVIVKTVSNDDSETTTTPTPAPTTAPIVQIIQSLQQIGAPAGPAVAGVETETPPAEIITPEKGSVEGATTCQTCIWWPFLLLQTLTLLIHYRRNQNRPNVFWKGGILLSVFTYAFFLFYNRSCRSGWQLWISSSNLWCTYFIIWVLLIFGSLSYLFRPKREEEYEVPQEPLEEN